MEKLIDYILDSGKRLVSPVGGGSLRRFSDSCHPLTLNPEQKLAHWMAFQTGTYGHAFLSATIPVINFCKGIGLQTTAAVNHTGYIVENQVRKAADLIKSMPANPLAKPELKPYTECISEFKKLSSKPVGGACFGPFTLAGAILGIERLCLNCIEDPIFLHEILDIITCILIDFARTCCDKGADFIWIAEPVAVLVSPEHFEAFSGNYIGRIKGCTRQPLFLHVPGETRYLIEAFIKTGAQCLSLDSCVDMRDMAHFIPGDVAILGNINSVDMLQDSPQTIEKKVSKLTKEIENFPNVIIGSGGGLSSDTPEENLRMLFSVTERTPVWSREEYLRIDSLWRTLSKSSMVEIIEKLDQPGLSGKVIAAGIEEALTYLTRCLKQQIMSIDDGQMQADRILKVLNTGIVGSHAHIEIDENAYRIDQLLRNPHMIFRT